MKKIILAAIAIITLGLPALAQRFAFVDTEYILKQMPEYNSAQKQLDLLALEWQKDLERKKTEIEKLRNDYEAEKIFLTDDLKNKREADISLKEKEYRNFQMQKFGVDGELFQKRQELIKPIQDKIFDAIQKVARDNAMDFIFDRSSAVTMLYANPKFDRSDEVLEEMGIVPGGEMNKGKTEQNGGGEGDDLPTDMPR